MEMSGEQRIAAPRQRVWEALNDPEVLRACIPGCQSLERDGDNGFAAVAEVRIGPIGARFKGKVALNDLDPPNGYTIDGSGSGGVAGNAKGSARVRLRDDGGGTLVIYTVDAQVGGRMAQLGGPIIDATAKQLSGKFFSRFGEIVGGDGAAIAEAPPATSGAPTAPGDAPAPAPFAIPAPAAAPTRGAPWEWLITVALAIVAGYMLGRSYIGEWWMVMVILTVIAAAGAGYSAGKRGGGLDVKPAPFDYAAPRTVAEACAILAEAGGGATVIAGGQTLMPLLNLRMSQPFILVDINKIKALRGVTRTAGGTRIGPVTRQADVLTDETLALHLPVFVEAVRHVGHHQTRNRGTVGGSIALGEPAAEQPASAVALGAELELTSATGTRRVKAEDFYIGPYMTAIEDGELLTAIDFPDWPQGHVTLFREVAQRPGDFALVGMVGAMAVEAGRISRAGLAWFGMGPTPIKARQAEAALVGRALADIDADRIAELAVADTAPFTDHHASAEYRRTVGRRLFARTLRESLKLTEAA